MRDAGVQFGSANRCMLSAKPSTDLYYSSRSLLGKYFAEATTFSDTPLEGKRPQEEGVLILQTNRTLYPSDSRKLFNFSEREGCRNFLNALASI